MGVNNEANMGTMKKTRPWKIQALSEDTVNNKKTTV